MNKVEQIKFIENNYSLYTNHFSKRRTRHDIFNNIQTELQSYLLGFYAADGSIDEHRKTFRIHLQESDSDIIYLFKDVICPDARTFSRNNGNKIEIRKGSIATGHGSFGVDITSAILCRDLVNLGIGYRKSQCELHIPNIQKDLIRHFIRGYFDGDGCITYYLIKEKNKNPRARGHFMIDIKKKTLIEEMNEFFKINNIKCNINYLKRDDMWRIDTSSREELLKLFKFLYDDSNFYLKRKFDKFNYYVNTEKNQLITDLCNAQKVNVNESNNPSKSVELPTIIL